MHETITFEGFDFQVELIADEDFRPPWTEEDGHGPVSDWVRDDYYGRPPKRPGQLILCRDHRSSMLYDFQEACRIARRDGWGAQGDDGLTGRAKAAFAARADYERLRRFCAGDWYYIGVLVRMLDDEGEPNGFEDSLWGVESDADDYLEEVARECAAEALARWQQRFSVAMG